MKFSTVFRSLKDFGVGWVFWRGLYYLAIRFHYFQMGSPSDLGEKNILGLAQRVAADSGETSAPEYFGPAKSRMFFPSQVRKSSHEAGQWGGCFGDADKILSGKIKIFSQFRNVGHPPDWFQGETGKPHWPRNKHWSGILDLSEEWGDIKEVWEASRFTQSFSLARAYLLSGEEKYAEGFWVQAEDWIDQNPKGMGPNWRCAQEVALRSLAWCFALAALDGSESSTPDRATRIIDQLWYHANHIEKVHWYSEKCVRNNHAISEAVALLTIGHVLPFLPDSKRWVSKGLKWLNREVEWQIYADGTYVQQSNNYARLVVQLLTWTLCLFRDDPEISGQLDLARKKAGLLLDHLMLQMDDESGELPNFGSNDGALLFPWSNCGYRDFRPSLHALSLALGRPGLSGSGPWMEEAYWFGLSKIENGVEGGVSESKVRDIGLKVFPQGGISVGRGPRNLLLFRCGPNINRPAQADMMHVDYWYQGANVLLDAGTYRYNSPDRYRNYFGGTRSHNSVMVDGKDQMIRGSRFLWLNWVQGELLEWKQDGERIFLSGRHDAYAPVSHHRSVLMDSDTLLVIDDLKGGDTSIHDFRLHWLINNFPLEKCKTGMRITLPSGNSLYFQTLSDLQMEEEWTRDDTEKPAGLWSSNYGSFQPAWSYVARVQGKGVRFVTRLGNEPGNITREGFKTDADSATLWNLLKPKRG